jgi:hypothetical protein
MRHILNDPAELRRFVRLLRRGAITNKHMRQEVYGRWVKVKNARRQR